MNYSNVTKIAALLIPLAYSAFAITGPNDDKDGDGLTNAEELALGTKKGNPDSDRDGLTDGEEVRIYFTDPLNRDTDGDKKWDGSEVFGGSDPLDAAMQSPSDRDLDGILDKDEKSFGTNRRKADTDGDSILDGLEVYSYRTNPLNSDTDGDGVNDNVEILVGSDPLDSHSVPTDPDQDNDGLSDGDERMFGTDAMNKDSDGDKVEDGYEVYVLETDPTNPDTDGDKVQDNLDAFPLDPSQWARKQ